VLPHHESSLAYALIGSGAFGLFCLQQYTSSNDIRIIALTDTNLHAARDAATRFNLDCAHTIDDLLARDDIDIVHIATPPFTHHDIVLKALAAGKHVLCEKPLATTLPDAQEMTTAAHHAQRLLAVNLIMRYNPLCATVKSIIDRRLLGQPLHAFFVNEAKDEPLLPDHWFWDPAKSGGIFIEHGVHFFDLFAYWLGPGRILSAQQSSRPGVDFVEQVSCTARYADGVLVNFYHGFHQPSRLDRQELRIVFERGELRLHEWVPIRMQIDCITDQPTLDALISLIPKARVSTLDEYADTARNVNSRHKTYQVDRRVHIQHDLGMTKLELYGGVLRALMTDLAAAIRDPNHPRRTTEQNALDALKLACDADSLARQTATLRSPPND